MTTATPANTFGQLFENLKTAALNAWQSLKNTAIAIEHDIVPVIEQDIAIVLSQFQGVAVNTILSLASTSFSNLSGTQKNQITVNAIVQAALANGKQIAIQDAQMLAQQAYNAVASTLGAAK